MLQRLKHGDQDLHGGIGTQADGGAPQGSPQTLGYQLHEYRRVACTDLSGPGGWSCRPSHLRLLTPRGWLSILTHLIHQVAAYWLPSRVPARRFKTPRPAIDRG
jgi:hypothetical protein